MLVHILICKFARAQRYPADESLLDKLGGLPVQSALSLAVLGEAVADLFDRKGSVAVVLEESEKLAPFFGVVAHKSSESENYSQISYIIQHFWMNVNLFLKINIKNEEKFTFVYYNIL